MHSIFMIDSIILATQISIKYSCVMIVLKSVKLSYITGKLERYAIDPIWYNIYAVKVPMWFEETI